MSSDGLTDASFGTDDYLSTDQDVATPRHTHAMQQQQQHEHEHEHEHAHAHEHEHEHMRHDAEQWADDGLDLEADDAKQMHGQEQAQQEEDAIYQYVDVKKGACVCMLHRASGAYVSMAWSMSCMHSIVHVVMFCFCHVTYVRV